MSEHPPLLGYARLETTHGPLDFELRPHPEAGWYMWIHNPGHCPAECEYLLNAHVASLESIRRFATALTAAVDTAERSANADCPGSDAGLADGVVQTLHRSNTSLTDA
jgi:hypothetical protein